MRNAQSDLLCTIPLLCHGCLYRCYLAHKKSHYRVHYIMSKSP